MNARGLMLLALLAAAPLGAQRPPALAAGLLSLAGADSAWAHAYVAQDTVLGLTLLDPDVVVTSSTGRLKDRQAEVADMAPAPGLRMHYFRTVNVRLRTRGETGIVTGVAEWEFEAAGRTAAYRRRYTAVYLRGGKLGWRMIALHLCPTGDG
jgi:ketosteroid isomerase-like protein